MDTPDVQAASAYDTTSPSSGAGGQRVESDVLPNALAAAFDARRAPGEPVLWVARGDLAPDGSYGDQYLVATDRRVAAIHQNGGDPAIREWPTAGLTKAEVETLVGQCSLVATIGGCRTELIRFSNTRQRAFHRVAALLPGIAEDKKAAEPSSDVPEHGRTCRKCGRPLPAEGGACPACGSRKQVLIRLVGYLRPYWKRTLFLIVMMIIWAGIETLPPYLTKVLIDDVINVTSIDRIAGLDVSGYHLSGYGWLALIVSFFLASRLVLLGIEVLANRQSTWLGPRIIGDLRAELYHHMQRLSLGFFDRSRTGLLQNRIMNDTVRLQSFLVDGAPHIGIDLFIVAIIGAILLSFNWQLTLLILVPLPAVLFASKLFWRYFRSLFGRTWGRRARLNAALNDSLSGIRVVKAFGQEEQEIRRFDTFNQEVVTAETNAEQTWGTFFPFVTFFSMLGTFVVWYVGGAYVMGGEMSLGTLLAYFAYLSMFYHPLQTIARANSWVTRDLTVAERVFEVLDTEPEIRDAPDAVALRDLSGEVRFENVVFGYDPVRPVIKGISIDIKPGEMVGLVGRSGAGKSTIINLLCRFYDPQDGRILIDGIDLRHVRQRDLHRHLGIVPQEPFLFTGTIAQNIAYAKLEATRAEIIRAARAANAHHFIMRFPDGYDTEVGERGARLSGGERQRISIARAILHDPKILILDEATSSVDTETEQQIQEAIRRLVRGRTTFAIAHRLSTLKHASRLLVIDDGKVAEFGTHDDLIEKDGIYAKLLHAQRELSAVAAVGG